MSLELRAIRSRISANPPLPAGFGVVTGRALSALVEVVSGKMDIQRYRQTLELWWEGGNVTILPVQAGAIFSGPNEVAQVLQERAEEFEQDLARLEGKHEVSLRLPRPDQEELPTEGLSRGLGYMRHLIQRETQLAELEKFIKELAETALDYKYELPTSHEAAFVQAAFLVRREEVVEFKQRIQNSGRPVVVLGPLPPFSFV